MSSRFWIVALLLAPFVTALSGCGGGSGDTARLRGTVTIGGQPLPADATGSVTFDPAQAGPDKKTVTVPIVNGQYDSPDTPTGSVKASFNIQQPDGPEYTTDRGTKARNVKNLVPEKSIGGVSIEVAGDKSDQDFDL